MTVGELVRSGLAGCISLPHPERDINGVYIGDLLSWVMGKAECDNAWITIMSNVNVIAVATLVDVSCVILAEGVTLDDAVLKTAIEKEVNILTSSLPIYELARELAGVLR